MTTHATMLAMNDTHTYARITSMLVVTRILNHLLSVQAGVALHFIGHLWQVANYRLCQLMVHYIVQVLALGRQYFGCNDLPYVPLENNGGSGSARYSYTYKYLHFP